MSCKVVACNSGIGEFQTANRTRYYQVKCVIGVHCATMSFKAMKLVILLAWRTFKFVFKRVCQVYLRCACFIYYIRVVSFDVSLQAVSCFYICAFIADCTEHSCWLKQASESVNNGIFFFF